MKQELIDEVSSILQSEGLSWPLDVAPPGEYEAPWLALSLEPLLLRLQAEAWDACNETWVRRGLTPDGYQANPYRTKGDGS